MNNEYSPHLLEWTDEKVARFWDFRNKYQPFDDTWFTRQAGEMVLNWTDRQYPIKGQVLDYGPGKGFLIQHLLSKFPSTSVYGCDFTESMAEEVDAKFRSHKGFAGCRHILSLPSSFESNFFDMVFLVETIEHLTDNYLHATLKEIHQVLKPGGAIVITTPNNEALEKGMVHCADCGASFHHMQHIRSWDTSKLNSLATNFNFKTILCKATNLQWYGNKGFLYYMADKVKKLMGSDKSIHLLYIGEK